MNNLYSYLLSSYNDPYISKKYELFYQKKFIKVNPSVMKRLKDDYMKKGQGIDKRRGYHNSPITQRKTVLKKFKDL